MQQQNPTPLLTIADSTTISFKENYQKVKSNSWSEFETQISYNAPIALLSQTDGQTDGHWHRSICTLALIKTNEKRARRYANAVLCCGRVSAHLSLCLSVTNRCCIETIKIVLAILCVTLCRMEIRVSVKNKRTPPELFPNYGLGKMSSQQHVDRHECCQLSSTHDRRLFITLSVHLCIQR